MIQTDAQYRRTREALLHLEMALAAQSRDKARYGPHFGLVAEGVVAEILKLRGELDEYIGLTDYLTRFGHPPTDEELTARPASANGPSAPVQPAPAE